VAGAGLVTRIGLAFPGDPAAASTWSGTPSGVRRGLADAGVEVVDLAVELPRPALLAARAALQLRYRDRRLGLISPELAALRTAVARRRLAAAGPLDGIVQVGTGYTLDAAVPVATYEDMTVEQAAGLYPQWQALPARALARRVERQRRAYVAARACCLTSRWAARSVVEDYGIAPEKVHVVGVGRNHEPPAGPRDWSSPRFLFVGREWERKNGPRVVRAFARLRRELPDATLDVAGHHPPLEEPGVTGHGFLRLSDPGDRARAEELFRRATCFVMPSLHEPSALAYVEASVAGLPIVGTVEGGSELLIGDGGILVDPRDDDALLDAMRRLADPATAERAGALARERSELFTWRKVAERLLRALGAPGTDPGALAEPL
jgi:glycosyltransferase involved in cell wall biosynthesis